MWRLDGSGEVVDWRCCSKRSSVVGRLDGGGDVSLSKLASSRTTGKITNAISTTRKKYNYNATRRRLELRISTMLLASLPGALKTELVAARQLSSGEIMYKVLRHYQPGGVSEKTEMLQSLTSMSTASTAKEATERLRKWRRHQLRAQELHVTLPDPSIMVKGLTTLCTDVLAGAPQAQVSV